MNKKTTSNRTRTEEKKTPTSPPRFHVQFSLSTPSSETRLCAWTHIWSARALHISIIQQRSFILFMIFFDSIVAIVFLCNKTHSIHWTLVCGSPRFCSSAVCFRVARCFHLEFVARNSKSSSNNNSRSRSSSGGGGGDGGGGGVNDDNGDGDSSGGSGSGGIGVMVLMAVWYSCVYYRCIHHNINVHRTLCYTLVLQRVTSFQQRHVQSEAHSHTCTDTDTFTHTHSSHKPKLVKYT